MKRRENKREEKGNSEKRRGERTEDDRLGYMEEAV